MSLVNRIVKTLIIRYGIYANIFAEKNVSSCCICKSYSYFFSKNTCELDIILTRTVNILTTNKLVTLTMLWTTGPWYFSYLPWKHMGTHKKSLKLLQQEGVLISTCNMLSCRHKTNIYLYIPLIYSSNGHIQQFGQVLVYSAPEVIKFFSCSNQLSMKFSLLINLKLLTIPNSFLPNIAKHKNLSANKYENANYCWHFHIY